MYTELLIKAAQSLDTKWSNPNFSKERNALANGLPYQKDYIANYVSELYENLSIEERRLLMKIGAYEALVEIYDNSQSSGVTRSDINILQKRLVALRAFIEAATRLGLTGKEKEENSSKPNIEVKLPLKTGNLNALNAIDKLKRFFNVLNNKKDDLGAKDSDLTLELLENRDIKVTFGTTLEFAITIMEIWSSLSEKSSKLKRINSSIEELKKEGIPETDLEQVASRGVEIVNSALESAKKEMISIIGEQSKQWDVSFDHLGKFLEGCLSEGYELRMIVNNYREHNIDIFGDEKKSSLFIKATQLAKYDRNRDDALIIGSRPKLN